MRQPDHLCNAVCDPHACPTCGACGPQPGMCRECTIARKLLPPRPLGRGLDAVRKELGLAG